MRLRCSVLAALTVAVGLLSRLPGAPGPVRAHAGDVLYAVLVALLLRVARPALAPARVALAAFAFCLVVELSQLAHAPWLDALRATTVGALVLGRVFVWEDLPRYAMGAALGGLACRRLDRG